ncbi:MAG: hypothetical protein A2Z91_08885 [Deltaproteobacteria bacterium GWA2_38_16]|nr:MAG: hypothetical protein A2Z91_08885 [Deltaproteobacteria bacterium GWA2_38_16]OGQ02587.1 MAG: hypothetical protein A3D19_09845 [Deltaproteobacteria bacterium RIFCSPHIGHO2_02_FULL_38_15]OGQ34395.1 MAG: hypothetical protein A3A72_09360 [Deltaproteobacteria bacterium RIFCSPLOWO2_01_FULL_38_9]OGQ59939.1 MAG: hypothetical protein A3G92_03115 [Deltaproteobacteria bacterium RIFCSPLOWO2_12_FULL_38_8]HBQ20956.1 hypothetical protein [Deltaproteobacteria bacterium]
MDSRSTDSEIYQYTDFRTFLKSHAEKKRSENPHWSLGVWARQLGLASTAVLTNVLNAKRNPGRGIEQKFLDYFKFNSNEKDYFQDLIRLEKVRLDPRLSVALMEKMGKTNPHGSFQLLDDQTFSAISKWYYYAIREIIGLEHFKEDLDWIQKNLEFKVTKRDIKKAISDLLKLNLIYRDNRGHLKSTDKTLKTQNDIASEALKRFHEHMLENAKESLRKTDVLERDITGRTFNLKEENLPKLKQYIREFRDNVCKLFEETPGTRTYQLNIQLFPLSKRMKGE